MFRLFLALPLLLATGCTTTTTFEAPVRNIAWQAIGQRPYWQVIIGDGQILFRAQGARTWEAWPRTLPRIVDGVRTWRAGEPANAIAIEARREPCTDEGGRQYEERVQVRLSGQSVDLTASNRPIIPFEQTLTGCGGRLVRPENS